MQLYKKLISISFETISLTVLLYTINNFIFDLFSGDLKE